MAPSLHAFASWRLRLLQHLATVNMLFVDGFGPHPTTKVEVAEAVVAGGGWRLALMRLAVATPLKLLLGSVGAWARSFDGFDLRQFDPASHGEVLAGWALPCAFAGVALPAMLAAGGVGGACRVAL